MGIRERKEREKEHRREAILDAAKEIFALKGLPASTMDEIADRAELSKATLYLYFGSKEDLFQGVAARGLETLEGMLHRVVDRGGSPLQILLGFSEAHEKFFRDQRDYFRMITAAHSLRLCQQVSEGALRAHREVTTRIRKFAEGILRKGIDEGTIRQDLNPSEIMLILWSNANALMQWLDADQTIWKEALEVDLWSTLRLSNRLIIESILTDAGKESYRLLLAATPASGRPDALFH